MEKPKLFKAWMIWIIVVPAGAGLVLALSYFGISNSSEIGDALILWIIVIPVAAIAQVILIIAFLFRIPLYRNERKEYKKYQAEEESP